MPCSPKELRHVPLFSLLDDDELAVLAQQVEMRDFAPMQRIYKAGEPSVSAFLVMTGAVRVTSIDQDGQAGGVGHVLQHLQDLGPGSLVVVAQAEHGGYGQAGCPDAGEPGLLRDLGGETAMRLHQEAQGGSIQQAAKRIGPGGRGRRGVPGGQAGGQECVGQQ